LQKKCNVWKDAIHPSMKFSLTIIFFVYHPTMRCLSARNHSL
jgi:hypothetical protein